MKRPRASIASAAASAIGRAAASASASGSGTPVTVGFEPMPQPSYPFVKAALALERVAVARVAGAVGDERLPELLARGGEVREDAEGPEGQQRGATAPRPALGRPPRRLARRRREALSAHPGAGRARPPTRRRGRRGRGRAPRARDRRGTQR